MKRKKEVKGMGKKQESEKKKGIIRKMRRKLGISKENA